MERKPIAIEDFTVKAYGLFESQWLLLTSGDFKSGHYNAMTISWGSLGVMWNKPFAQVVVRPVRYTFEFIQKYETFTLCAFPAAYRKALSLLGMKSGRDGDKINEAGLCAVQAKRVSAPAYAEAELVIECRKLYWQDLNPENFLDPGIAQHYPRKDYHRMVFGEIVAVEGSAQYAK